MAAQWERWLKYAKAKVDDVVKQGDAELERREAELEARRAGTPWTDAGDSFDQAKARIKHMSRDLGTDGSPGSSGPAGSATTGSGPVGPADTGPPSPESAAVSVQMAARQKAAEERLAAMRAELGLEAAVEDAQPDDSEKSKP